MARCQTRNLTISLLVVLLPMNVALAGGRGGVPQGAVGSGLSGASGYGAAVGGGAPAGAVGGGPPAGLIGGGLGPTNTNSTRSSGGGLGPGVGSEVGVPGAYIGIPSAPGTPAGGLAPSLVGKTSNTGSAETGRPQGPVGPKSVEGVAATQDADSAQLVAPRPCGVAAHETDGFTTCIGILPSGHERSGRARRHTGDMRRPAHRARS
jgi:hypothetical protein